VANYIHGDTAGPPGRKKDGRIIGWQRIDLRGGKFQTSAITTVISSGRVSLLAT
jgi:hypothetical protein